MEERQQTSARAFKAATWEAHIRAWEMPELSQVEFCRQNGLKHATFMYWRQKFPGNPKPDQGLRLVPLQESALRDEAPRQRDGHASRGITLIVRGVRISVDDDFDEATLVRIVQALKGV